MLLGQVVRALGFAQLHAETTLHVGRQIPSRFNLTCCWSDGQFDQRRPNAPTERWHSSPGELPRQREVWGVRDLDTLRVDGARMGEDDPLTEHVEEPNLELHLMRQGLWPRALDLSRGVRKYQLMLRWRPHLGHHDRLAERCPPASVVKRAKIRDYVVHHTGADIVEFELDGDVLLSMANDVC